MTSVSASEIADLVVISGSAAYSNPPSKGPTPQPVSASTQYPSRASPSVVPSSLRPSKAAPQQSVAPSTFSPSLSFRPSKMPLKIAVPSVSPTLIASAPPTMLANSPTDSPTFHPTIAHKSPTITPTTAVVASKRFNVLLEFSADAVQGSAGLMNAINITYTVVLTSSQSASQLSSQLATAVTDGTFDTFLQTNAITYNAPGFSNCVSSSVTITSIPSTDDDKSNDDGDDDDNGGGGSGLNKDGKIAIIVVVVLIVVSVSAAVGYYFFFYRARAAGDNVNKSESLSSFSGYVNNPLTDNVKEPGSAEGGRESMQARRSSGGTRLSWERNAIPVGQPTGLHIKENDL